MSFWTELASRGAFAIRFDEIGGVRTRYLEAGDGGEAVVLLHGTGGHLETYVANVMPHAARFRVFVPDLLGHGFTGKPDRDYEIRDYVAHLRDFLDAKGIARAHLSGESLGGWIAAQFAIDHPERVARLVLNTAGGLTADPQVMARVRDLSLAAVEQLSRETVRKRLEWLMYDPATVTDELVDMRYAVYSQPGFLGAMRHIVCLQEMETRRRNMLDEEHLERIAAPTLVIWTTHDPTGAVEVGERFRNAIPNARLVVLDRCAHWPQYEQADAFNALQIGFLTEPAAVADSTRSFAAR
ncbi:MAG: hypothetical protein JWN27_3531 [Candidatus Eremiobacteraeota bacterium]|nr:hypothetical protein [Candidatus Eremiobacteraeota bacterium]